jgi:hypothetical protein
VTNSSQDSERRQYQRIPFIAEVVIEHDDQKFSCSLLDISLKGLLVEPPSDTNVSKDSSYSIELVLGEDAAIKMEAKISHDDGTHWGMEWNNIDLEGLTHLRRLLELNMSDPDEVNRELADLG